MKSSQFSTCTGETKRTNVKKWPHVYDTSEPYSVVEKRIVFGTVTVMYRTNAEAIEITSFCRKHMNS